MRTKIDSGRARRKRERVRKSAHAHIDCREFVRDTRERERDSEGERAIVRESERARERECKRESEEKREREKARGPIAASSCVLRERE